MHLIPKAWWLLAQVMPDVIDKKEDTMSQWDTLQMDAKISQILAVQSHDPDHHFGRPFLTSYQIAIAFHDRYPQDFQTIGKPIGGKGTGQQDSLEEGKCSWGQVLNYKT